MEECGLGNWTFIAFGIFGIILVLALGVVAWKLANEKDY